MRLIDTLLNLDKLSDNWRCEVDADQCSLILDSDISNDTPTNIGDLPKKVLEYIPDAILEIGSEGSRVLYVKSYSGKLTYAEFDAKMQTIGQIFHASESNRQTGSNLCHCWRFWWD